MRFPGDVHRRCSTAAPALPERDELEVIGSDGLALPRRSMALHRAGDRASPRRRAWSGSSSSPPTRIGSSSRTSATRSGRCRSSSGARGRRRVRRALSRRSTDRRSQVPPFPVTRKGRECQRGRGRRDARYGTRIPCDRRDGSSTVPRRPPAPAAQATLIEGEGVPVVEPSLLRAHRSPSDIAGVQKLAEREARADDEQRQQQGAVRPRQENSHERGSGERRAEAAACGRVGPRSVRVPAPRPLRGPPRRIRTAHRGGTPAEVREAQRREHGRACSKQRQGGGRSHTPVWIGGREESRRREHADRLRTPGRRGGRRRCPDEENDREAGDRAEGGPVPVKEATAPSTGPKSAPAIAAPNAEPIRRPRWRGRCCGDEPCERTRSTEERSRRLAGSARGRAPGRNPRDRRPPL